MQLASQVTYADNVPLLLNHLNVRSGGWSINSYVQYMQCIYEALGVGCPIFNLEGRNVYRFPNYLAIAYGQYKTLIYFLTLFSDFFSDLFCLYRR